MGEPLANNPSLRRARLGVEQTPIFDLPSFQPLSQHFFIHRDVLEHPLVTDVIETAANIAFPHPRRARLSTELNKALRNSISGASARPKAIGVSIRRGFRDGAEREQVESLHRAIMHRRDSERT